MEMRSKGTGVHVAPQRYDAALPSGIPVIDNLILSIDQAKNI